MLLHRLGGEVGGLLRALSLVARKGHPLSDDFPSNFLPFHLGAPSNERHYTAAQWLRSGASTLATTRSGLAPQICAMTTFNSAFVCSVGSTNGRRTFGDI